jgi:hypothetical protein
VDEDDELPDEVRFVAALNETAEPGVDNQLFWVLTNHPQWWDLVLEADLEAIWDGRRRRIRSRHSSPGEGFTSVDSPPNTWWEEFEMEIRLRSDRRVLVPLFHSTSGCWLSRDDLQDLFAATSYRTKLKRLRLRGGIRVEKVNPHGWVRLPLSRKMKCQTSRRNLRDSLRDIWDTLDLSTGIGMLLILGGMFAFFAIGYFALQILFGLSLDLFGS